MNFINAKELLELCKQQDMSISQIMMQREIDLFNVNENEILKKLQVSLDIMKDSTTNALQNDVTSLGGLVGGEAKKMQSYLDTGIDICGDVTSYAIMYALSVAETNASMGLIVAAPTAGASGVIPGALMALKDKLNLDDEVLKKALLNASAIGYLLTRNASVSGAQGGCQAEVGSASAMAASAITEILGGSPTQCASAASFALMNLMGLVCDPVGGLVEIPCQMRNVVGTSTALTSAQVALSGTVSKISLDDTIDAMYKVGNSLPRELRETALGGVAATPSACELCKGC